MISSFLINAPNHAIGKVGVSGAAMYAFHLPEFGALDLYSPLGNDATTNRMVNLLDYSHSALTAFPSSTGNLTPTELVNGRYFYHPRGLAGGVRRTEWWRYDAFTDSLAVLAAITTLAAGYSFPNGQCYWDGADFIFFLSGWDGVADQAVFRYSISGNSWAEMTDHPGGLLGQPIGCKVGTKAYTHLLSGGNLLLRTYDLATDTWNTALADPTDFGAAGGAQHMLTPDLTDTDKIWLFNVSGGNSYILRYSIGGDTWTDLSAGLVGGLPASCQGQGHYRATPVPHILFHSRGTTGWYMYKI